MRKLIINLLFATLLISCSSDDENNPVSSPGENSTGTFVAEIDGQPFDADKVKAYPRQNFTVIEGEDETNKAGYDKVWVKILIRDLREPRLYAIGEDGNGFIYNVKATINFISDSNKDTLVYTGQFVEGLSLIDVTELNSRRIVGTVGFRGSDKNPLLEDFVDLREGRFNITF